MTNKTIKFYGIGYGPSDAAIDVTIDGAPVFTGPVFTLNESVPVLPDENLNAVQQELFSITVPVDYQGTKQVSLNVTNGTVIFARIDENYKVPVANPVFSDSELSIWGDVNATAQQKYDVVSPHATPPFSQDETDTLLNPSSTRDQISAILSAHEVRPYFVPSDSLYRIFESRRNIKIDGVEVAPDSVLATRVAPWWYIVNNGSTLTYSLTIDP